MRIMLEALGSLTSGYLIKAIHQAGHEVVGSDISDFNHGKVLSDHFIIMPKANDHRLWDKTLMLLKEYQVNIVLPSLDETLEGWSQRIDLLDKNNIKVIISPIETISIFQDKWKTYQFFKTIGIRTPMTSLSADYSLIKPRLGRGGTGIFENRLGNRINMDGMISQEKIEGIEYTVDTLFDKDGSPVYIVPRIRIDVKEGKSTKGIVVNHPKIDEIIMYIAKNIKFIGPINFQLFETPTNELIFIEVNPRISGGMALGFAATENWIELIIKNIVERKNIAAKPVNYGLKMARYYEEVFIQ